ncbi:MAG TPA: ADP-ribosylglycohydrolase family protein, partial [Streptosporangiaceae bacterium]
MRGLERLDLMDAALAGLSVGDAFGDQFFLAANRGLSPDDEPPGPWEWSDDTELACSVADVLRRLGWIDQGELAAMFAARFDPSRRYGAGLCNCWSRYGPACHGGKPARRSSAAGAPIETAARCGSPRWALITSGTRPEPQL